MARIPVTGSRHLLPFDRLSAFDFERLCLWLVRRQGYRGAEHLGEAGSEQGRDVVAWKDGKRFSFQCKRVQSFTAADARKEIAKIRGLPATEQPAELVFVVSKAVSTATREKTRKVWGDEATCRFWTGAELDERVKRHDDIVAEFFQLPPQPSAAVEDGGQEDEDADEAVLSLRTSPASELPDQPYPVLLPYAHPQLMAGREAEVRKLRLRLRMPVPILGLGAPSGTGKSSLLLGGLVPALRCEGAAVAVVRHPHEAGIAGRLLGDLVEGLEPIDDGDWPGFVAGLAAAGRLAGEAPLLVLDQFEDVLRAAAARARLGVLLAATTGRRPGTDEPLCRWLLAYRVEFHGEILAWLEDVLAQARAAGDGDGTASLPYDLSGPDRFHELSLTPFATPPPAGEALFEATRVFQAAIEKPLAVLDADGEPRYPWRFAPGHARRLAAAFAETRLARPAAPLVPELQVVLAHLLAASDGTVEVPEDPGELIGEALADHLRRALEAAYPAATEEAATRRARALLALRELATAGGERGEGMAADEMARAIGDDGEAVLEQLATPLTRLVVLRRFPGGLRWVLAHDRMAEVVADMVDQGCHGDLPVDGELLPRLPPPCRLEPGMAAAGQRSADRFVHQPALRRPRLPRRARPFRQAVLEGARLPALRRRHVLVRGAPC